MKKQLLYWLLSFLPFTAAAQFPIGAAALLVVNGAQAGSAALKNRANKPGEFTTYFRVGPDSIASKRTPEPKLRGAAASEIRALEQYLAATKTEYDRREQEFRFDGATAAVYIQRIRTQQPKWDVTPYEQEAQFYAQESRTRYTAARAREQQARQVAQQRAAARQDSLYQLARRQQATADSLREDRIAQKVRYLQDSLASSARQDLLAGAGNEPATVVAVGSKPKATASPPKVGKQPLVAASAKPAPRRAQTNGPKAYICNNGRTEVYHSSEGCSAMNRCTYATRVVPAETARAEGLRACLKCY